MILLDQDAYKAQMQQLAERAWDLRRSEREEAALACEKLLQLAEVTDDKESLSVGQLVRGLLALYIGKQEEALVDIEQSYAYFSEKGHPLWRVRCLNSLGYAHVVAGTLGEALVYWNEGLELSRKYKFDEMTGFLLYNIGDLQKAAFKRYEDALLCFIEASEYCKEGQEAHSMCGPILASISECQAHLGNNKEAMLFAEKAMTMAIKLNDNISIGLCAQMLASLYIKLEDLDKAKMYCMQGLEVRERINDKFAMANSLLVYSDVLLKSGEPKAALTQAKLSLEIVEGLKSTVISDVIYEVMAQAYEALGDYKNSSECYKNFAKAQASRLNGELDEKLNLMTAEMRFDVLKKDAEIHRLKNVELREKNEEIEAIAENLSDTLKILEETHEQLIRSEKMASLIGLVSGVAHEINTPLGNGITMLSYIKEAQLNLRRAYDSQQLMRSTMQEYFDNMNEAVGLLDNSLSKVAQIIKSFKKIGFHARQEGITTQNAKRMLMEWELGLNQKEQEQPRVSINCSENVFITTDFSALTEILDELYLNARQHAFTGSDTGSIAINMEMEADEISLVFYDNGVGTFKSEDQHLFEPFYKGSSTNAGMGLGLHMVYTLVTLALHGIIVKKESGQGTCFEIRFKNIKY